MGIIAGEKGQTFKELEQEIFRDVCQAGVVLTQKMLEAKDEELFKQRDASAYKSEGFRKTSIKTLYGPVAYSRRVYRTVFEDGRTGYVYLLDEYLGTGKMGLISENLAERIADLATEVPCRETAAAVTEMTGTSISAQGAWGIMQKLGERVSDEERHDVAKMASGESEGKRITPVLFEEMDGVWIRQQGRRHEKKPMQEVKVAATYEGWDEEKEKQNRSTLLGKHIVAGIEDSRTFHEKREADICKRYDVDEIGQRIVNGDGGSWIGEPNDPDAIIQLDPFHIHREIRRLITDKEAQDAIEELLKNKDIEGMLSYIRMYADSVDDPDSADKRAKKARELYKYLSNNKDALIPWKERDIKVPEPPDGVLYKGMGVQENQNCTVITLRMKHRRMRWSRRGGNNMAKLLSRKENRELHDTVSRYSEPLVFGKSAKEAATALSAAKAPKKDGKGSPYLELWNNHMPILEAI